MLVVDEFQRLRADLQGRVVQNSAGFEHLLVLTATPDFKLPARHAQFFALIEPERVVLASRKLAHSPRGVAAQLNPDDLTGLPLWAAEGVIHHLLTLDQAATTPGVLGSLPLSDVCSVLALGPWQHHTPAPGDRSARPNCKEGSRVGYNPTG